MKKILIVALMGIMLLFAGCSSDGKGAVTGSVNGQDIYQAELDYYFSYYFEYYYQNYYSYYLTYMGVDLLDEESASEILAGFEQSAWESAINAVLIEQVAGDLGVTYADNYLEDILPWGNYRTIKVGTLNSQLYDVVREQLLNETVVDEAVSRAAYDADPAAWDSRQTSHILIMCDVNDAAALAEAKAEAEDLIEQLNNGADFAALAREHSDDGSAADGGALGTYINEAGQVVGDVSSYFAEYTAETFALEKVGDYSQTPVLSEAGYHIIKIDDIREGYEACKEMVDDSLKSVTDEQVNARVDELMAAAEENAEIVRKADYRYYEEEPAVDDDAANDDAANDDAANDDAANDDAANDVDDQQVE